MNRKIALKILAINCDGLIGFILKLLVTSNISHKLKKKKTNNWLKNNLNDLNLTKPVIYRKTINVTKLYIANYIYYYLKTIQLI